MAHVTPLGIPVPDDPDAFDPTGDLDKLARKVDDLLQARALLGTVQTVRKTTTQSVNNTTTPVADTQLLFTTTPNSAYIVDGTLFMSSTGSASGADFKFGFQLPGGAAATFAGPGPDPAMASGAQVGAAQWSAVVAGFASTISVGYGGVGTVAVLVRGSVVIGSTAGNVALMWSQNTATGVNTSVLAGSYLTARKV